MHPVPVPRPLRSLYGLVFAIVVMPGTVRAQTLSQAVRQYVSVDAPVVALTGVTVIDGTGARPVRRATVVLRNGRIAAVGDSATTAIPGDAEVHHLPAHTVLPGFVMVHEHMFYPAGNAVYSQLSYSFPRLYLAGGATTIRTGGSMSGYADINLARAVAEGRTPGPTIDATAPYLNGPGLPIQQVKALRDADDARRMVNYWADEGATSFKAYMQISRDELRAAVDAAHARGLKVTGHLCSVTYREAADIGIDNLEHGFLASTDFVADKELDRCPGGNAGQQALMALDPDGPEIRQLMQHLIERNVAITSTLTVFETFTPNRPPLASGALEAMLPEARIQYLRTRSNIADNDQSPWTDVFPRAMRLEKAFADAGGLLIAGTDPTGYGGVVAGFANQRAIELLVEAGFSPVDAIRVGTLNGARYLERDDEIGSIAAGKAADLIVVHGDPVQRIEDIRNVRIVFKGGVGYDPDRLREDARARVGLN